MSGQSVQSQDKAPEGTWQVRVSGWVFAINVFLGILVLTLGVAVASVVNLRASVAVAGDATSDPAMPLTISGVSLVEGAIDGESVHVAATQRTLIVSFAASALWHSSPRNCLSDIVGAIDWQGQATWIGERAGHVDAVTGDLASMNAYVGGLGSYCEPGRYSSLDGGLTWSSGPLAGAETTRPKWLAFDPTRPSTLLAFYPGTMYSSSDDGATWTSFRSSATPLAFDSTGRLVGWAPGKLFASADDGATWDEIGAGPLDPPVAAAATPGGVLIGTTTGLLWYPPAGPPELLASGSVYSIAALGHGAVVLGADSEAHPWLGTVTDTEPGISLATLPADVATLHITGGEVAVNDAGAAVAFSGPTSAIGLATFNH